MNDENFVEFSKYFFMLYQRFLENPNQITDIYPSEIGNDREIIKKNNLRFYSHCIDVIKNSKVFEIDDEQKKLIALSDPPEDNSDIKLPFSYVFLDINFTKEELESLGVKIPKGYETLIKLVGVAVTKGELLGCDDEKPLGESIRFTVCMKDEKGYQFNTFTGFYKLSEGLDESNITQSDTTPKLFKKFIYHFFLSFLNFLNNPDVEYVEHKRDEKNIERKIKQGKIPITSTMRVIVSGKLKVYIDEIKKRGDIHMNHKFWVRGHYRRLRSQRYIEKRTIFIYPFVKGRGSLVNKSYNIRFNKKL